MFHFHKLQLIRRSFATLSITNTTASSQKQILAFQQLLQSTKKNQTTTEEINTFLSKHPTFVDNDSAAALFQALRPQITDSTTPQQISQHWRSLAKVCCQTIQPEAAILALQNWTEDPYILKEIKKNNRTSTTNNKVETEHLPNHSDLKTLLRACCVLRPINMETLNVDETLQMFFRRTQIMTTLLERFHSSFCIDEEIRSLVLVIRSMSNIKSKKTEAEIWSEALFLFGELSPDWHFNRVMSSCLQVRKRLARIQQNVIDQAEWIAAEEEYEAMQADEAHEAVRLAQKGEEEEEEANELEFYNTLDQQESSDTDKEIAEDTTEDTTENTTENTTDGTKHEDFNETQKVINAIIISNRDNNNTLHFELAQQRDALIQLIDAVRSHQSPCDLLVDNEEVTAHQHEDDTIRVRATTHIESLFTAHAQGLDSLEALRKKNVIPNPTPRYKQLIEFAFNSVFQSMTDIYKISPESISSIETSSMTDLYLEFHANDPKSIEKMKHFDVNVNQLRKEYAEAKKKQKIRKRVPQYVWEDNRKILRSYHYK